MQKSMKEDAPTPTLKSVVALLKLGKLSLWSLCGDGMDTNLLIAAGIKRADLLPTPAKHALYTFFAKFPS